MNLTTPPVLTTTICGLAIDVLPVPVGYGRHVHAQWALDTSLYLPSGCWADLTWDGTGMTLTADPDENGPTLEDMNAVLVDLRAAEVQLSGFQAEADVWAAHAHADWLMGQLAVESDPDRHARLCVELEDVALLCEVYACDDLMLKVVAFMLLPTFFGLSGELLPTAEAILVNG